MRVLIVEDETQLAQALARGLRRHGFTVDLAADGGAGLHKASVVDYDAVVLDRDLPVLHGDEVCRRLNESGATARILMLTAAGGLEDLVDGLDLGADDYLVKPVRLAELTARLRALGRRGGAPAPAVLRHGDLELDPGRLTAARAGRELELSPREFAVLELLVRAEGRLVSAEEMLDRAWDENADPFTSVVRVVVSRLRREARRAGSDRDGAGQGVPDPVRRASIRVRLTLWVAGLVTVSGAIVVVAVVALGGRFLHDAARPAPLPPGVPPGSPLAARLNQGQRGQAARSALNEAELVGLCARSGCSRSARSGSAGRWRAGWCARCTCWPRRRTRSRTRRSTAGSGSRGRRTS